MYYEFDFIKYCIASINISARDISCRYQKHFVDIWMLTGYFFLLAFSI